MIQAFTLGVKIGGGGGEEKEGAGRSAGEQIKSNISKRKEIITMRAESSEIENAEIIKKNH